MERLHDRVQVQISPLPPSESVIVVNELTGWVISRQEKIVLTVPTAPTEETSSKTVISFTSLKAATDYRAYLLVDENYYRIGDFSKPKGKKLLSG